MKDQRRYFYNYEKIAILKGDEVIQYLGVKLNMPDREITEIVKDWCKANGFDYEKDNFSWEYQEITS